MFKALDDFADHAARASAIFWPSRAENEQRGRALRESVSLSEESPLKERGLRHRLQHFDERLEKWLKKPQSEAHTGDLCIDSKVTWNGKRIYGLREFDSERNVFIFQGTEFPIDPVENATRTLLATIRSIPAPFPRL